MYKKIITNMIKEALRNKYNCPIYITAVENNDNCSVQYRGHYFDDDNNTITFDGFVSLFGTVYCWSNETLNYEPLNK